MTGLSKLAMGAILHGVRKERSQKECKHFSIAVISVARSPNADSSNFNQKWVDAIYMKSVQRLVLAKIHVLERCSVW
jgi:hypothetical protein